MVARTLVSVLALAVAAATQTFIVDAASGPGTHFTDIPPAVAAVPDGAVLRVRAGTYNEFTIDGKSLAVLGETGAQVTCLTGPTVMNLLPHQAVVLHGLDLASSLGSGGSAGVTCQNNHGVVRLAGLRTVLGSHVLSVQQCDSVFVVDCVFHRQTSLVASTVVFTSCGLGSMTGLSPALVQQGGRTQLVGCQVAGMATPQQPGVGPIQLNGGEVRVLGGGLISSQVLFGLPPAAVTGTGAVRLDPSVSVLGASQFAPAITVTVQAMPHVTATDGLLGGTSAAALHGPNGHLGLLAVGFAGPAFDLPGVFVDPLFWAQGNAVTLSAGVPAPGQPVTGQVAIPGNPVFAGLQLLYQGITLDAAAGLQLSNPAVGVVR
ncbi:MAG TPA: hypothetical protein VFT55_14595 [Planctomycetota bacterium]|nr:hypothetical protein [Planctomycetota bacterium]